jgi:hypothetical protein
MLSQHHHTHLDTHISTIDVAQLGSSHMPVIGEWGAMRLPLVARPAFR